MAAYSYQAYNAKGKRERGVIEADSERAARQALRARGLLPESVTPLNKTLITYQYFITNFQWKQQSFYFL